MTLRTFPSEEAAAVLQTLQRTDHELGPGRDLFYEVTAASGDTIRGLVVSLDEGGITLADVLETDNTHHTMSLADVAAIAVRSYT